MLFSLTVTACAAAPAGPQDQIVTAWHSLSGTHERVLLDMIDEWNRSNPYRITVVPERQDDTALHSKVMGGITRNMLPALVLASPMQTALYDQKGAAVALNEFMNDQDPAVGWSINDRADLYAFMLKAGRAADARILGVPFGGVVQLVFYNVDWLKTMNLESAPATWEQFSDACAIATDRSASTLCFGVESDNLTFEQWLYAHGGQITTNDNSVLQVSTPLALEAMGRLYEFVQSGQAYRVASRQQSHEDFASSRVLFTFDWSDQLDAVTALVKQRSDFDWQPALLPADERQQATKYQAPLWVITRAPGAPQPNREKAAWLFVRWLTDNAQTARWAAQTGELPSRVSAINTLSELQPLSAGQLIVLQQIAPMARPDPLVSGWRCIEDTLTSGMRLIFEGRPLTETLQTTQMTGQAQLTRDCSTP